MAWRDGDGLLTKTQQRVGKVLELQRRQKKLQDLLERELKVLSKVINEKCSKCEKRPAERECVGEDGIRIKQVDLNALDTDYLVLPTLSCLSMDDKTRAEPFWKCVLTGLVWDVCVDWCSLGCVLTGLVWDVC